MITDELSQPIPNKMPEKPSPARQIEDESIPMTLTAKPTWGLWRASKTSVMCGHRVGYVATPYGDVSREELEANARLMASSKVMFQALTDACEMLREVKDDLEDSKFMDCMDMISICETVLMRAQGLPRGES